MSETTNLVEGPLPPVFHSLKGAIVRQFQRLGAHSLFRTKATGDELWETYLASFPNGTNPIYRRRTHHDCSCCRHFIRTIGNVVAIIDGGLVSIWEIDVDDSAYRVVSGALASLVKSRPIDNRFLHYETTVGTDRNYQDDPAGVLTWDHFHVRLPNSNERSVVCPKANIGPLLSEARGHRDVLFRSLSELSASAAETVLDLIDRNTLYRGEEHRHAVASFLAAKRQFDLLPDTITTATLEVSPQRDAFVWQKIGELPGSVSRIRNTSIGQLLIDLSEGRDLEDAVRAYERMVAPTNYKRPTALVTQKMVDAAKDAVEGLGLTSALDRRFATLEDVSVNNVLFADRRARRLMKGGAFADIPVKPAGKANDFSKVQDIPVERFLTNILPGAEGLEIIVENRLVGNFVSLIAPTDPVSKSLFIWENRFSWSYAGDVADSMRERVKRAGGDVTGDLCCRLAWSNFDDLDLHMKEPSGYEIYHGNKGRLSPSGGALDVDMNAGGGRTREPVENIVYASAKTMQEGVYRLFVNQYFQRERTNVGFDAELDICGSVCRIRYDKPLRTGEQVMVADIRVGADGAIQIVNSLPSSTVSRKVWNIDTEAFQRVNVVLLSPNHWDAKGVGNRHYFWMLDGCRNDGSARGFYNEFLSADLAKHRKVFEILGAKMRAEESPEQLSGLGFSSTQRNHVIARVTGAVSRAIKVIF